MPRAFETVGATGCDTEVDSASAGASPSALAARADVAQVIPAPTTPTTSEQPASGIASDQGCLRENLCISVILGMGTPPQNSPVRRGGRRGLSAFKSHCNE